MHACQRAHTCIAKRCYGADLLVHGLDTDHLLWRAQAPCCCLHRPAAARPTAGMLAGTAPEGPVQQRVCCVKEA